MPERISGIENNGLTCCFSPSPSMQLEQRLVLGRVVLHLEALLGQLPSSSRMAWLS